MSQLGMQCIKKLCFPTGGTGEAKFERELGCRSRAARVQLCDHEKLLLWDRSHWAHSWEGFAFSYPVAAPGPSSSSLERWSLAALPSGGNSNCRPFKLQ